MPKKSAVENKMMTDRMAVSRHRPRLVNVRLSSLVCIVHLLIFYALAFQRNEQQIQLGGVGFWIGFVAEQPPED